MLFFWHIQSISCREFHQAWRAANIPLFPLFLTIYLTCTGDSVWLHSENSPLLSTRPLPPRGEQKLFIYGLVEGPQNQIIMASDFKTLILHNAVNTGIFIRSSMNTVPRPLHGLNWAVTMDGMAWHGMVLPHWNPGASEMMMYVVQDLPGISS